jgi:ankyrin repeat protein
MIKLFFKKIFVLSLLLIVTSPLSATTAEPQTTSVEGLKLVLHPGYSVILPEGYSQKDLDAAFCNACSIYDGKEPKRVHWLLSKKADVNAICDGITPLYTAVQSCEFSKSAKLELVKLLLAAKANVNVADHGMQFTPLHWAALNNHAEMVSLLVLNEANVNATDYNGETPLHKATLVIKEINSDSSDSDGSDSDNEETRRGNNINIIRSLITAKANIGATDHSGKTALAFAKAYHFRDVDHYQNIINILETTISNESV